MTMKRLFMLILCYLSVIFALPALADSTKKISACRAMKSDREKCIAAGMDDYVPKPIKAKELFAITEKLSQRGK